MSGATKAGGAGQTVGYEERPSSTVSATLPATDEGLASTLLAPENPAVASARPAGSTTMMAKSKTVLPRASRASGPAQTETPRYISTKVLGEGGMGEVVLAEDNDIDRRVAIKRLHADVAASGNALLRFADEVRIAGALQHPNIVPVYDVGIDAEGQHYFVMKFLDGESLESVIEKLRAGDAEYARKYTYSYRVTICIEILHALEYAHSRGVLHRDLKPANVMIGRHGEVTIADWGIAKKITPRPVPEIVCAVGRPAPLDIQVTPLDLFLATFGLRRAPAGGAAAPRIAGVPARPDVMAAPFARAANETGSEARPHATAAGALLGTPLYMSPEQAAGRIDELDERSDLFSASVMFAEFLSLKHYLKDRESVVDVLDGVLNEDFYLRYGIELAFTRMPAEITHVILHGMWREPERRWQSAKEMAAGFERTLSGDIWVCCPFTLTRRTAFTITRWANEHPRTLVSMLLLTPIALVTTLVALIVRAVH